MKSADQADRFGDQHGFTLIEMLVVLVILAMTMSIATPLLRGPSPELRLATLASRIAGALRSTRAAAIARSQDMSFVLEGAGGGFSSPVISREVPPPGVTVQIEAGDAVSRDENDTPAIRFFADGSSTGGAIVIRMDALQVRVEVNALSGRARVVRQ